MKPKEASERLARKVQEIQKTHGPSEVLCVHLREGPKYKPEGGYGYYDWQASLDDGTVLGSVVWSYSWRPQCWWAVPPNGKKERLVPRHEAVAKLLSLHSPGWTYHSCARAQDNLHPNPGTYDYYFWR